MTKNEEEVIQWACHLAEAIVAGSYGLPRPLNIAVNTLQDKVWDLAKERGWKSPKDGCSPEFLEEEKKYWQEVEDKLKNVRQ
jgi:hypothetical protein